MSNLKIDLDVPDFVLFIDYLVNAVNFEADNCKEDCIARYLRKEINTYIMALNKKKPDNWKKYLEEFKFKNKLEKDPKFKEEYGEYLRLKDKFKEVPL